MRTGILFITLVSFLHTNAQNYTPSLSVRGIFEMVNSDSAFASFTKKCGLTLLRTEHDTIPGRTIFIFCNPAYNQDSNRVIVEADKIIETVLITYATMPVIAIVLKTYNYATYKKLGEEYKKMSNTLVASSGMLFDFINKPGITPYYAIKAWQGPR